MLKDSNILDLYSGIGSFGLECISLGAKKVTFVEQNEEAAKMLNDNLKNLPCLSKARIFNKKVENIFKADIEEKYDLFFFDPPFANKDFVDNLKIIRDKKIFKKNHIIIIHRENNSKDDLKKYINIKIIKIYGRSKIFFGSFN